MAKKLPTVWGLDPHSEAKHIILRRYLQAWLPIMTRWNGRVLYIDGFAGPGIYSKGEEGSPIIALKAAILHTFPITSQIIFLFIEDDHMRKEVLEQQIKALAIPNTKKFTVHCIQGKCDATLTPILDALAEQKQQLAPTFAFLDPFGFSHTPLSLVAKIMEHPRCEVLITFMYEEINRFLNHEQQPENYDALFGCPNWRDALALDDPAKRKKFIHDLYKNQLEQSAGIEYVRSFEMINQGNRTDYFLFFGTKSIDGLKKMKEAMWKTDAGTGIQFSDATDMNQTLLFEREPSFSDLKGRIISHFKGKVADVEEIERFVLANTPYRETHFKRQILKPMEDMSPPELIIKRHPPGRKKGTFPPGVSIEFV